MEIHANIVVSGRYNTPAPPGFSDKFSLGVLFCHLGFRSDPRRPELVGGVGGSGSVGWGVGGRLAGCLERVGGKLWGGGGN